MSSAPTWLLGTPTSPAVVTFTAKVVGLGGVPTGTVDFVFMNGTTVEKTITKTLSGGTATLTTTDPLFGSSLTLGTHSVFVRYSGNATFASTTSATTIQTVRVQTTQDPVCANGITPVATAVVG